MIDLRRRAVNPEGMSDQERRDFNKNQRIKYFDNPLPYLPVECHYPGCTFVFVPLENAFENLCPAHRYKKQLKKHYCPFMEHELQDAGFFSWGKDDDLPTDFNHANYTPVR